MGATIQPKRTNDGLTAEGCCTPKEDRTPQKVHVPPKKVLPIVFLPGIMGSNLIISESRQKQLNKKDNIAWRPDRALATGMTINESPAERQLRLDPNEAEVDVYDPVKNLTGSSETAAERHMNSSLRVGLSAAGNTPLLTDDLLTQRDGKSKEQKAMSRGWGEIYFSSYRKLLENCETILNRDFEWDWQHIVDTDPATFGAAPLPLLRPLSRSEKQAALKDCFFPVHAMGYNWLKSNRDSAKQIAIRIKRLVSQYKSEGYQCEKVILVTHSMGGLVARGVVHPGIGNIKDLVLGVVHGVMPAIGAPAAYRRIRCGFEEALIHANPAPKILGNFGSEVTAVLANSPGGLELLPTSDYGNDWLEIRKNGVLLRSLPKKGDPYGEIYSLRGRWYGLLREKWINPAELPGIGFENTLNLLEQAKKFHELIRSSYHPVSYAHYGADPGQRSWEKIVWEVNERFDIVASDRLVIIFEGQTEITMIDPECRPRLPGRLGVNEMLLKAKLGKSRGAGDQTVPLRSAESQLTSGKFSGIFRQLGYDHQDSYSNSDALHSTFYSIVKIIAKMRWDNAV
ncbi:esterase/lipase family protein [Oxalobacteraceae bacterium A2-2]